MRAKREVCFIMTNEELVLGGAIVGGFISAILVFGLVIYIFMVIASWKIFTKAGIEGWKSLIPIYNAYLLYKIAGVSFWVYGLGLPVVASILSTISQNTEDALQMLFSLASCVIMIYAYWKFSEGLAKSFGKGTGFALGLLFLPNIFQLILAFGDAKYQGKME